MLLGSSLLRLVFSRHADILYCSDVSEIQKGLADFTKHLLAFDLLHAPVSALVAVTEHIEQLSRLVFTYLALSAWVPWTCAPGCVQLFQKARPVDHVIGVEVAARLTIYLVPPHGHATEHKLAHTL